MIKVFKLWWAWEYEKIEKWLEEMEASGLRLVKTRIKGLLFYFEKCTPCKARYCIDYQAKLTPDYIKLIGDDAWELFQVGMGWYILRKEYRDERPDLYTDFEGLIARNKTLLTIVTLCLLVEFYSFGNLIWDAYHSSSEAELAGVCIGGTVILAFFSFIIVNISVQIAKFRRRQ